MRISFRSFFQSIVAKLFPTNWWPAYKLPYAFTSDWFTYRISIWGRVLKPLAEGNKPLMALEIGTHEGRSALWLLENVLTHEGSKLVCMDPYSPLFRDFMERFLRNIELGKFKNKVDLILKSSREGLLNLEAENFDLIYIDGDHGFESIMFDAEQSWRLLKCGGILIFDDYLWPHSSDGRGTPMQTIDLFLKNYESKLEILDKGYQILLRKLDN